MSDAAKKASATQQALPGYLSKFLKGEILCREEMEVDQLVTDLKDSEAEVPEAVLGQLMSSHLAVVVSMLGAAGEVSDETLLRGVV
jgi:hypothetical protein